MCLLKHSGSQEDCQYKIKKKKEQNKKKYNNTKEIAVLFALIEDS